MDRDRYCLICRLAKPDVVELSTWIGVGVVGAPFLRELCKGAQLDTRFKTGLRIRPRQQKTYHVA